MKIFCLIIFVILLGFSAQAEVFTSPDGYKFARSVAFAFARSIHPKAASYLLQMRFDKFYAIRMDVIHYLGRTKTAESTKLFYEMLKDENAQISGEAKRYLLERGEKVN